MIKKKPTKTDLIKSDRDRALKGLEMMKELEKSKKRKMKTIIMDDGKTLISATKERMKEIVENYDKRRF